ncbi:MAG: zinc ABC transporter solute-binding protein [Methanomicrobiales archaeon]|nr:zinc ABC transporter solute-binding protein [Methanomicrobiales archaeon]
MKKFSFKLKIMSSDNENISIQDYAITLLFLLLSWSVLLSASCGCMANDKEPSLHQPVIACTIPPQEEFIKEVAGDYPVKILVMVPPGSSPHTFEPTPSQIAGLESADMYIALGSGIEFENRWISRIKQTYPSLRVVNLSENINFCSQAGPIRDITVTSGDDAGAGCDPHMWLSLKNAAIIVNTTAEELAVLEPDMKENFFKNRDNYNQRLADADRKIRKSLEDLKTRTVLVYHPAFGYFCRDYNLTQMAVEEDGREPSSRQLADLIIRARSEGINIVFTEPEGSTRQAETLARELNGTMVLISPLAGNYLENMQQIAEKISGIP